MRTPLYWIEGSWVGRLAIAPRPRGGDWLEDEVRSWRQSGLDVMVSLLTPDEVAEFELGKEGYWCQVNGITFFSFPIPDRGVPASRRESVDLVGKLKKYLLEGKKVAVHCRQGIGRSAIIAAGVLIASGEEAETAFRQISEVRGCPVPETIEQREWVRKFASTLLGEHALV